MSFSVLYFFNDTSPTHIYTLSLHDALPISARGEDAVRDPAEDRVGIRRHVIEACPRRFDSGAGGGREPRSEEHTSELQSLRHLVCRLLLEKKKKKKKNTETTQIHY